MKGAKISWELFFLIKILYESNLDSIFGQSGARAPISGFPSLYLSLLAYGEVLRIVGGMETF